MNSSWAQLDIDLSYDVVKERSNSIKSIDALFALSLSTQLDAFRCVFYSIVCRPDHRWLLTMWIIKEIYAKAAICTARACKWIELRRWRKKEPKRSLKWDIVGLLLLFHVFALQNLARESLQGDENDSRALSGSLFARRAISSFGFGRIGFFFLYFIIEMLVSLVRLKRKFDYAAELLAVGMKCMEVVGSLCFVWEFNFNFTPRQASALDCIR